MPFAIVGSLRPLARSIPFDLLYSRSSVIGRALPLAWSSEDSEPLTGIDLSTAVRLIVDPLLAKASTWTAPASTPSSYDEVLQKCRQYSYADIGHPPTPTSGLTPIADEHPRGYLPRRRPRGAYRGRLV